IELFAKDGIDLLHPRANYAGEPGILVLEFPIFQAICTKAYKIFGPHTEIIRAMNIVITLMSGVGVFAVTRRRFDPETALAAACLFISSPLNLVYMSAILIDPFAVCTGLWTFYFGDRLLNDEDQKLATWLSFTVCCFLTA